MHHTHYRKKEDAGLEIGCGLLHFPTLEQVLQLDTQGTFFFFFFSLLLYTKIKAAVVPGSD